MNTMPNMTIAAVCDQIEMKNLIKQSLKMKRNLLCSIKQRWRKNYK